MANRKKVALNSSVFRQIDFMNRYATSLVLFGKKKEAAFYCLNSHQCLTQVRFQSMFVYLENNSNPSFSVFVPADCGGC